MHIRTKITHRSSTTCILYTIFKIATAFKAVKTAALTEILEKCKNLPRKGGLSKMSQVKIVDAIVCIWETGGQFCFGLLPSKYIHFSRLPYFVFQLGGLGIFTPSRTDTYIWRFLTRLSNLWFTLVVANDTKVFDRPNFSLPILTFTEFLKAIFKRILFSTKKWFIYVQCTCLTWIFAFH